MKRHRSLHILSQDHHNGLITAQLIKKNSPEYPKLPKSIEGKRDYAIRFYDDELVKHFADEEEILFPVLKERVYELDKFVKELTEEHRIIEDYIKKLKLKEDIEINLDKLGNILENHIRKEERLLFPKVQDILNEEEINKIGEILSRSRESKN